jgi:hypothetical protein
MLVQTMLLSESMTRDSAILAGTVGAAAIVAAAAYSVIRRRRPSPAERERLRRTRLAQHGRIVDGTLLDVSPSEEEPATLRYGYWLAGVSYECVQDVSALSADLGPLRLGFPILVRYDRENPANSMVVAEEWTGLKRMTRG